MKYFIVLFFPIFAWAQSSSLKSPNVSGNALFLGRQSNWGNGATNTVRNGIDVQEAELAFYADVDPYSRLNMLFAIHPEYEWNATNRALTESWEFEPEELYAETDHVKGVTFKVGKFKAAFGKHNELHAHAYPFIDAPLVNTSLLGDEGLNDVGASSAILLPTSWYSEITLQYLRGEGENSPFASTTPNDGEELVHFKNLFDLSESLTFELGGTYATGDNSFDRRTHIYGADLTFKWRPVSGGKYRSFIFSSEYINRTVNKARTSSEDSDGVVLWGKYQLAERWATALRAETMDLAGFKSAKGAASVQFMASEFSSFRFEYEHTHDPARDFGDKDEHKFYLQANFTIGAHPSHAY